MPCANCGTELTPERALATKDGHVCQHGCDFGPYERHEMPSGAVCFYRDDTHTYHSSIRKDKGKWVGQGRWGDLPSPSQIAKFADPNPDPLMDWAARKQVEGVFQLGSLDAFPDADSVKEALKKNKLTWRDLRDSAGDLGTFIHNAFERGLHGDFTPSGDAPDSRAEGHLIALDRFFTDHPDIEPLQTEAVVYSTEHRFAGRFDARVRIGDLSALLDLKTSGYIGRAYHAQVHGYDLAAEECGYGASDRLLILQTREEGTYTLWPVRSDRATFLHALALYRAGKECDAQTRKDWKELAA